MQCHYRIHGANCFVRVNVQLNKFTTIQTDYGNLFSCSYDLFFSAVFILKYNKKNRTVLKAGFINTTSNILNVVRKSPCNIGPGQFLKNILVGIRKLS